MILYDGNRETLKSCSLTCRAWLPTSRARLFEFVSFCHPKDILSFSEILRHSPCLAHYVRGLDLRTDDMVNGSTYSDEVLDTLQTILESMEYVRCRSLSRGSPDLVAFLGRLPRMDSVSKIHFECILFDNIGCYTRIFPSLPNVEKITLVMLRVKMPGEELILLPVIAPKLRKLKYRVPAVLRRTRLFCRRHRTT